jgi:hypothetical protein
MTKDTPNIGITAINKEKMRGLEGMNLQVNFCESNDSGSELINDEFTMTIPTKHLKSRVIPSPGSKLPQAKQFKGGSDLQSRMFHKTGRF